MSSAKFVDYLLLPVWYLSYYGIAIVISFNMMLKTLDYNTLPFFVSVILLTNLISFFVTLGTHELKIWLENNIEDKTIQHTRFVNSFDGGHVAILYISGLLTIANGIIPLISEYPNDFATLDPILAQSIAGIFFIALSNHQIYKTYCEIRKRMNTDYHGW